MEKRVGKKGKGRANIEEASKLHHIQQCGKRVRYMPLSDTCVVTVVQKMKHISRS